MSTAPGVRDYLLGNSPREQDRLKLQARVLGRWTESYLLSAGLEPGMRVLDVGTGMGDVALLAAKIVGPSGAVLGIDRDPVVLEKAAERSREQGHSAPLHFEQADVSTFRTERFFDAVIGRYILLYQPDPANALKHFFSLIRPGGILCFHETAFGLPLPSYPAGNLVGKTRGLIGETFRRMNINTDMGLMLVKTFADAGLPRPMVKADILVGGEPGSYLYAWFAETIRSLLPKIEEFGLARAEDLEIDTLAERMEQDAVASHAQILGPLQFGAWVRKP